jgi:hypothetical protein
MKRIFLITILGFCLLGCSSQSKSLDDYFEHSVEAKDYFTHVSLESNQGIFFSVHNQSDSKLVYAGFILEYTDTDIGIVKYQYNLKENYIEVYKMVSDDSSETICLVDTETGRDNETLQTSCDEKQIENANKVIDAYNKILEDTDSTQKDILNYMDELTEKYDDN